MNTSNRVVEVEVFYEDENISFFKQKVYWLDSYDKQRNISYSWIIASDMTARYNYIRDMQDKFMSRLYSVTPTHLLLRRVQYARKEYDVHLWKMVCTFLEADILHSQMCDINDLRKTYELTGSQDVHLITHESIEKSLRTSIKNVEVISL